MDGDKTATLTLCCVAVEIRAPDLDFLNCHSNLDTLSKSQPQP